MTQSTLPAGKTHLVPFLYGVVALVVVFHVVLFGVLGPSAMAPYEGHATRPPAEYAELTAPAQHDVQPK